VSADAALIVFGRGGYRAAMYYMAAQTPGPVVSVATDHELRNGLLMDYYAPLVEPKKEFRRFDFDAWPKPSPHWLILHSYEDRQPQREVRGSRAGRYILVRDFPHAGVSGWHWYLYRKALGDRTFEPVPVR
jgi:hypothetical protein